MPAAIYAILVYLIGTAIARVLLGAGLTVLTYNWLDTYVINAMDAVVAALNGAAGIELALIAGAGEALSIIGSALVVRATIEMARIYIGKS